LKDRDLADVVYEKINDIGQNRFVQSHSPQDQATYSEIMVSVLVVVN